MESQILVSFRRLKKPDEEKFHLELAKDLGYDEITILLAEQLSLDDPSKIKLTAHNFFTGQPKPYCIKLERSLSDMLCTCDRTTDILYYEVLDVSLTELEQLKILHINVLFHTSSEDEVEVDCVKVLLSKQNTFEDVINEVKKQVELSNSSVEFRLLEIRDYRITKIFYLSDKIGNIRTQHMDLRAEEIPEEEKQLGHCDYLVRVFHCTRENVKPKDNAHNFGHPFLFLIRKGEKLVDIKKRIQKKLQVEDDEFSKWKFSVLKVGGTMNLDDNDILSSHFEGTPNGGVWIPYLGIEHSSEPSNLWYFPSMY